ncbi:hypothetical protein [Clostridium butyricum]|uniref:hypothetical protein n=1 Tax=Clostridium butyricum TaxID=1492 RepID=UPI0034651403
MRYYVDDKISRKRVYLRGINAKTRKELCARLNSNMIRVENSTYAINEVKAVPSVQIRTWGDLVRSKASKDEEYEAQLFNNSYL